MSGVNDRDVADWHTAIWGIVKLFFPVMWAIIVFYTSACRRLPVHE